MFKVVAKGMKEELLRDDNSPTVQLEDPLEQQDDIRSGLVQTTDPEANTENENVCKHCGKVCATRAKLKRHVKVHTRKRNFKCDWPNCAKAFQFRGDLKAHKRTHTGEKPHKCTEPGCTKTFSQTSTLNKHKLVHTGEKPHQCLECGKTFALKVSLKFHKVTHSGDKPYRCSVANCGKAYTQPSGLQHHKKTQHKEMLQGKVEVEKQLPAMQK